MKTFICLLGLAAACAAGAIESKGSSDQESSNSWQPSNAAPVFDYSSLGNGFLAGLGQHQAISHEHDNSGPSYGQNHGSQTFGHDAAQGYDLSGHGQAKSFNIGHHALPSFGASGHDFSGDSYLQAAHDFSHQGQGGFNGHGGELNGQNGGHEQAYTHADVSAYAGESNGDESNGHSDESNHESGDAGGHPHPQLQPFLLHDGGNEYGHAGQEATVHDLGAQGYAGHDISGQSAPGFEGGFGHAEPFSVGEHTDEQHPVEVPLYKHVTVPVPKTINVNVPKPILVGIPQPYPVKVPVNKPVAVPVETEITIPIEKVVPYPVVKHVPYPVEKHVPYKVEKTIHVHVPQPYPVKIPIYKTIHHHKDH